MLCIHHNDLDGRCSAAIVAKKFKKENLRFLEMDYKDEFNPDAHVHEIEKVIIVDFSLQPETMERLLKFTEEVIWIDHHKTAERYPYQHLEGLRDFSDKGNSGCELAWKYFFPDELMPDAVRLIGDYDKWALNYDPECFQYYEGMKLRQGTGIPSSCEWEILLQNNLYTPLILNDGKVAIEYRDAYCSGLLKSYGYETEIDGVRAYACNQYMFGSKGFGEKFDEYPLCLAYIHDGNKFIVSLYSTTVDVSEIAKNYGGGGHKGAAGFVCDKLPWVKNNG
jgi:oligoribonuclease NrnB/cAMP/cGMP phosphodiesterase (DHH superfamily)